MTEFLDACYRAIRGQASSIPATIRTVREDDLKPLSGRQLIMLLGCGDSYAVAEYGRWALLTAGFNAISLSPPELQKLHVRRDYVVIGVSASGRTLATVEALEFAKSGGAMTIALTDNPQGKIAQLADRVWQTSSGLKSYEISPSSTTTSALTYLLALAAKHTTADQSILRHDIGILESKGDEIVRWSERQGIAISKLIETGKALYLISDGPNYAAAQIGMMKLDEFSVVKGIAALREEFQHHYNMSIDKDERAVVISDNPVTPKDERFLMTLRTKLGMRVYALNTDDGLGLLTPLAQTIPNMIALQVASYYAVLKNDPNKQGFRQPHAGAFKIY